MEVILLAAGLGKRMEISQPKQFLTINGKPMLAYSLEVFNDIKQVSKIILVCQSNHMQQYKKIIRDYKINNVEIVIGGATRQESVYNGLEYVKSKKIIIHEAARPLISKDFVENIIDSFSLDFDAVVPVISIPFTVAVGYEKMDNILERSSLKNIQLPQIFKTDLLKEAHAKALKDNYTATEDSMLVFKYGGKVKFTTGRESNIKITSMYDVRMVSNLLSFRK